MKNISITLALVLALSPAFANPTSIKQTIASLFDDGYEKSVSPCDSTFKYQKHLQSCEVSFFKSKTQMKNNPGMYPDVGILHAQFDNEAIAKQQFEILKNIPEKSWRSLLLFKKEIVEIGTRACAFHDIWNQAQTKLKDSEKNNLTDSQTCRCGGSCFTVQ